MDFLSICDPKSFSSVKTVEIKGSIYDAAALSGVPCLLDALTRARVEDMRIVWNDVSHQLITAKLCGNVQLILDRFLAAPWTTTVCEIDKVFSQMCLNLLN